MSLPSDNVAYEMEDPADVRLERQRAGYDLTLRVVPMAQVVPHEHYHGQRVDALTARLLSEGKLINPPIVAQQGEHYVVLDGATRLTALRHLGYPYIIVQVVDLSLQRVHLTSWNHAVYGGRVAGLLEVMRGVAGLRLTPFASGKLIGEELPAGALGYLVTADQQGFLLETHPASATNMDDRWLHVLNEMVAAYGLWGNVERTLTPDVALLASQFPDLAALVLFPAFTPQTIMALADQGRTVPAGITRFVIHGRILRLNVPLAKLLADEPLADKQAWLDNLIGEKLLARQVRFYEEPVVLLDE